MIGLLRNHPWSASWLAFCSLTALVMQVVQP
jgi:hypothetical protein